MGIQQLAPWETDLFSDNVSIVLQQQRSRLLNAVLFEGGLIGATVSPLNSVGKMAVSRVTTLGEPLVTRTVELQRRWLAIDHMQSAGLLIDNFDRLSTATDPRSSIVKNAVSAFQRNIDDTIINAFFAASLTGARGATSTVFDANQVVAVDADAAGAVGLTVAKLLRAQEMMMANEALSVDGIDGEDNVLHCAVSAKQYMNLMNEVRVTHGDYNMGMAMQTGRLPNVLGYQFHVTQRLAVDGSSYRMNPVWVQSGMFFGMWGSGVQMIISTRNDLSGHPWQVYGMGSMNATRLDELKVIKILSSEA